MYETIQSPVNYGGLQLKNRIIFAPTTFGLSDEEYFEKIRRIAAGGCAMVIIGDVPVGKSMIEKSLFDKKGFAYYQKLTEIVHSYDCRICAQLHQSDSNMLAMLKYVPGVLTKKISMQELRPLLNAEVAPYISKLSVKKIKKITDGFGKAERMYPVVYLLHGLSDDYTAPMNTAAVQKTALVLPSRLSRPSAAACRSCPSTTSWPSVRRSRTTATPVCWSLNWGSLCRCWWMPVSPASM